MSRNHPESPDSSVEALLASARRFAEENPPQHGRTCRTCQLPEREALDILYAEMNLGQIRRWLASRHPGEKILSSGALKYHFTSGHHVKDKRKR